MDSCSGMFDDDGTDCTSVPGARALNLSSMGVARRQPVEKIVRPFQDFAEKQSSGGILLIAATVAALVWANSPWGEGYAALWHTKLTVGVGDFSLSKDLTHWINDGLMAIFFLVVGLEIKREVLVGELSSVRGAALPVAAAVGGATVPALIYLAFNLGSEGVAGWGIPMATDIAFALGVLGAARRAGPRGPQGVPHGARHRGRYRGGAGDSALLHLGDLLGRLGRRGRVLRGARGGQPDRGRQDTGLRAARDRALACFPALGGARHDSRGTPGVDRSGQLVYQHGRIFEARQVRPRPLRARRATRGPTFCATRNAGRPARARPRRPQAGAAPARAGAHAEPLGGLRHHAALRPGQRRPAARREGSWARWPTPSPWASCSGWCSASRSA